MMNNTVTISTSLSNPAAHGMISTTSNGNLSGGHRSNALPLSMNNSIPNNHSNLVQNNGGHNNNNGQQHNGTYHNRGGMGHLNPRQQRAREQRQKLEKIVSTARNKLQLIDSKHIAFEYEVGRGKFGKVFRALWTDTNTKQQKTVAVKWFKQDEVDQEVFEDFLKEIC